MGRLGGYSAGSIVQLNVSKTLTNFLVANQGLPSSDYDSSCDGTWLVLENIAYDFGVWDSTNNDYANSDIHNYLNSTFLGSLDTAVQNAIKQVKIPYTNGVGTSGVVVSGANGLSTKVFLLSMAECGFSDEEDYNIEGAKIDIEKSGSSGALANGFYTRTPHRENDTRIWDVYGPVASTTIVTSTTYGFLPVFILPSNLWVDDAGNLFEKEFSGKTTVNGVAKDIVEGYANVGGTWKEIVGGYANVGGVWKEIV